MPSYRELLQQVKTEIDEVSTSEAAELARSPEPPLFVDVRERDEWDEGFVPGALWIARGQLESRIEGLVPEKGRELILYCSAGSRSAFAAKALGELGYTQVSSMAGGFVDWKRNGFEVQTAVALTPAQRT